MALREREWFIKLGDKEIEDLPSDMYGWVEAVETSDGGGVFEMTTDFEATMKAVLAWVEKDKDLAGAVSIEQQEGICRFLVDGELMSFDTVMRVFNNFLDKKTSI